VKGFTMKTVKFIHCADLHLDSPMTGLKYLPEKVFERLQQSTFKALATITEISIREEVDFVVISGDIFDGEDRSLRAQARLRNEMSRLQEKQIPVYLIHGNHDHLGGTWPKMDMPENVHVFGTDVEVKRFSKQDGTSVHLYGFSYPRRHVTERWVEKYEKQTGADFHIGLLHGHFEGVSQHGMYAPFHIADLIAKQFDYWALGHIHKREILASEPPVVYPGNPQGRSRKETGVKGCYLVTLNESGAELAFQETNDVLWVEKEIDGMVVSNPGSLYDLCKRTIAETRIEGKGVVLTLEITNLDSSKLSLDSGIVDEIMEALQEQESEEQDFVWVRKITLSKALQLTRSNPMIQGDFFNELFVTIDQFDHYHEALSSLYEHRLARKHLTELAEEERVLLLKEAEEELIKLLNQE